MNCETCGHYDPYTETYGLCFERQKYVNRNDNCNDWKEQNNDVGGIPEDKTQIARQTDTDRR